MNTPMIIAIDGPAASGKSTVARELARRLGFACINSGAFYRAITWWMLKAERDTARGDDPAARLGAVAFVVEFCDENACLLIDGVDSSGHLRDADVNENVSRISQIPRVREIVGRELRRLAESRQCVIEGRDIGTCVFPETSLKFYVDATPEERARRRSAEGQADRIAERDRMDSQRAVAPLVPAANAVVIDSTHLGIEEVVSLILCHLKECGVSPAGR